MSTGEWIFGLHAVAAALKSGAEIGEVLLAAGRRDRRAGEIERLCRERGIPVQRVRREDLDALSSVRHQGVGARLLGSAPVGGDGDLEALLDATPAPLLLVLEGVTDPRNLGAAMRSADAAGAHGVVVPRMRTAPLTEAARRTASGAAEHLPLFAVANLARTLRALAERGILLVGLAGEAGDLLWDLDLSGPCALLLGSEEKGLRRLTREHCDHLAALPMAGSVGSLNVSVAAGVALFEAARQRRQGVA